MKTRKINLNSHIYDFSYKGDPDYSFETDSNLAGAKAWRWKEVSGSGTQWTFTLESPVDISLSGETVSIKAEYSWNYCGTLTVLDAASGNVSVELTAAPPDNWTPDQVIMSPRGYLWFPENPEAGVYQIGPYSFAEGCETEAHEWASHSEGYGTVADGRYSHAEGCETTAGYSSHAEGYGSRATGLQSHAEGYETNASGNSSHAEGAGSTASGSGSHAEGTSCIASGLNSHAGGQSSVASGLRSFAHGLGCSAPFADTAVFGSQTSGGSTQGQFVRGRRNYVLGAGYIDIVGGGAINGPRLNLYVLDTDGNLHIRGKIYQNATNAGCTDGEEITGGGKMYEHVLSFNLSTRDGWDVNMTCSVVMNDSNPVGVLSDLAGRMLTARGTITDPIGGDHLSPVNVIPSQNSCNVYGWWTGLGDFHAFDINENLIPDDDTVIEVY